MMKLPLLIAASSLALAACASRAASRPAEAAPSAPWSAAVLVQPAPSAPVLAAMEPVQAPAVDLSLLPPPAQASPRDRRPPAERVEAANQDAVREPSRAGYVNAAQVYAWTRGALYRLYTAPERVSEIALQPGETLISVAAGDTARWVIGDTTSGSGAGRRTHILVKPTAADLRTNLVITTDRRVYHVQLESTAATAMASISWTYPADDLLAVSRGGDEGKAPVAAGIALEALDFGYAIEGDDPPWRPLRAFDDGRQVFIEFPASLAQGEAPPLFVRGAGGESELVNYRVRGRYYIVDRLFEAAELRLGEQEQQVVRIIRDPEDRHAPRSSS